MANGNMPSGSPDKQNILEIAGQLHEQTVEKPEQSPEKSGEAMAKRREEQRAYHKDTLSQAADSLKRDLDAITQLEAKLGPLPETRTKLAAAHYTINQELIGSSEVKPIEQPVATVSETTEKMGIGETNFAESLMGANLVSAETPDTVTTTHEVLGSDQAEKVTTKEAAPNLDIEKIQDLVKKLQGEVKAHQESAALSDKEKAGLSEAERIQLGKAKGMAEKPKEGEVKDEKETASAEVPQARQEMPTAESNDVII